MDPSYPNSFTFVSYPYLSSFQSEVILYSTNETIYLIITYGGILKYREKCTLQKNGKFGHKMGWIWKPTSFFILNICLMCPIFEILTFCNFSESHSTKFSKNGETFSFDPLQISRKIKFSKIIAV